MVDYPTIPITIVHSPTDWPTVYAALFAAFFGALAVFVLNIFLNKLQDRRRRLEQVNLAIYGLAMSTSTLLNLKRQGLLKFDSEFRQSINILANLTPTADEATVNHLANDLGLIFRSIIAQDPLMDGAFKIWPEIEFPMMPKPQDLSFTVEYEPDLVRLVHLANIETTQVSKRIVDRNHLWQKDADGYFKSLGQGKPGIDALLYNFQILSARFTIQDHVNTSLVVIDSALERLRNYRQAALKRKGRMIRWFFEIFTGKEKWTDQKMPEKLKALMPDKEAYKSILEMMDD